MGEKRYCIRRPLDTSIYPGWNYRNMDKYHDQILILDQKFEHSSGETILIFKGNQYLFNEKWCTEILDSSSNDLRKKFLIKKPENVNEYPSWCERMNRYDGKVLILKEITQNSSNGCKIMSFEDTDYLFNEKWCVDISPICDIDKCYICGKEYRTLELYKDERGIICEECIDDINNNINTNSWEERRFKLSSELYIKFSTFDVNPEHCSNQSIKLTDIFIREYRKRKRYEENI